MPWLVPAWASILRLPYYVIYPGILIISVIGVYSVNGSMFDVWMMLVFGVLGYVFKKLKYPLAPLVLALVLGDMAETSFRQAMLIYGGLLVMLDRRASETINGIKVQMAHLEKETP